MLDADYEEIEQEIDKFKNMTESNNLNQLQTQIKTLAKTASTYARYLRDLEEQRHTIAINKRNYTDKLRVIKSKVEQEYSSSLGNDISFLEEFSRKNCRHF